MTLEEAVSKLHWIKIGEDGVIELYLDHHMLSTFRWCEGKFELDHVGNIRVKNSRNWNLEFGIIWHKMVERYYQHHFESEFNIDNWLSGGVEIWNEKKMDEFQRHKMFILMGGVHGFLMMMAQYATYFTTESDRLRLIGLEIPFGKKKEVFLGSFVYYDSRGKMGKKLLLVRCYLTGRIDFLMDNGFAIGPLDHKTTSNFGNKNMNLEFDPQEGMTGYVFATRKIIEQQFPQFLGGRRLDRIWMNFAQLTPDKDPMKRFKRIPIFKTPYQLEEYRQRQLRTFKKILDLLLSGDRPDWNTYNNCKIYNYDCQYKHLHQQNSASNMFTILQADFIEGEPWNTETVNLKE